MSQHNPDQVLSFQSAGALAARVIVKLNTTAEQVVVAADATEPLVGVSYDKATAADQTVGVIASGTAKVIAGGTIARGAFVTGTTSGHAAATTTAEDYYVGIAMQAAVSGDIFEVKIQPGHVPTA